MRPHRYTNVAVLGVPFPGATFGSNFTTNQYQLSGAVYGVPSSLPGWTFTRASTGYAETAAGALVAFASGAPRITDKGLLVEEARTNLVTYSQDFDNAAWGKTAAGTGVLPVVTANDAIAPDGTMTADRVVLSLAGGVSTADQSLLDHSSFGTTTSSTYTGTVYVKGTVGEKIALRHVGGAGYTIHTFTGAWDRVSKIDVALGATSTFAFGLRGGVGGVSNAVTFWAWGADCELGAFATSYTPTTTASATRAADVPAVASGSWLDASLGTIFMEILRETLVGPDAVAASLNGGSAVNTIEIYKINGSASANVYTAVAGVSQTSMNTASALTANVVAKWALSYQINDFALSVNGLAPTLDTSASVPAVTQLSVGNRAGSLPFNGYIRRVVYYPTAFTDAQLQAATA